MINGISQNITVNYCAVKRWMTKDRRKAKREREHFLFLLVSHFSFAVSEWGLDFIWRTSSRIPRIGCSRDYVRSHMIYPLVRFRHFIIMLTELVHTFVITRQLPRSKIHLPSSITYKLLFPHHNYLATLAIWMYFGIFLYFLSNGLYSNTVTQSRAYRSMFLWPLEESLFVNSNCYLYNKIIRY